MFTRKHKSYLIYFYYNAIIIVLQATSDRKRAGGINLIYEEKHR